DDRARPGLVGPHRAHQSRTWAADRPRPDEIRDVGPIATELGQHRQRGERGPGRDAVKVGVDVGVDVIEGHKGALALPAVMTSPRRWSQHWNPPPTAGSRSSPTRPPRPRSWPS